MLPRQWVFHLCQITDAVRPGYDCTHVATSLKFKRFRVAIAEKNCIAFLKEYVGTIAEKEATQHPTSRKICPREGHISIVKRVRNYEGILENISDIYSRNFI